MAFVNFDRWMDLNPEEKERMGQRAMEGANPSLNAANYAVGRLGAGYDDGTAGGRVAAAQSTLSSMGNTGGLAALMSKPHEQQASVFDAALAGGSNAVGKARSQNLGKMMTDAQGQYDVRKQQQAELNARNDAARRAQESSRSEQAEQDRLKSAYAQQRQYRIDTNRPQGASEYAAYSDQVQSNRRPRTQSRSRNFFDFFGR